MEEKVSIRAKQGALYSGVGIALNFILATAKIIVGFFTGLVSVIADGVNNFSDCGSGAVSLVSFRISAKPADREHPYGHQRAEYVASMIIACIVLLLAFNLFRESIEKLIAGSFTIGSIAVYAVLGGSIFVKALMFVFYRVGAKKLNSDTLKAAATDSICDCISTFVVLVCAILAEVYSISADGYAGIFVAGFIALQGVGLLKEASSKLLGQAPDEELMRSFKQCLLSGKGVLGIHDVKIYSYGTQNLFATAHIEMDASLPAISAHELLDEIEKKVKEAFSIELTAHLDPVDLHDGEAIELEERVRAAVEGMVEGMGIHDFRIIRGAFKRVLFDVSIPFDCPKKDYELQDDICRAVRLLGDYEPMIEIERE